MPLVAVVINLLKMNLVIQYYSGVLLSASGNCCTSNFTCVLQVLERILKVPSNSFVSCSSTWHRYNELPASIPTSLVLLILIILKKYSMMWEAIFYKVILAKWSASSILKALTKQHCFIYMHLIFVYLLMLYIVLVVEEWKRILYLFF